MYRLRFDRCVRRRLAPMTGIAGSVPAASWCARARVMVMTGALSIALGACTTPPQQPRELSEGHLVANVPAATPDQQAGANIPKPVRQRPYVPVPQPAPPRETYTVVVNEVPVKELLFALARDGSVNIDVHPAIEGQVTLNAVDQTLTQILNRIAQQVNLRYEEKHGTLLIAPDTPYLASYKFDYVNITRDSSSTVETSTKVATTGGDAGGGGGSNTSETTVSSVSNNRIWETLIVALRQIVNSGRSLDEPGSEAETVIANPESGIIMVSATSKQHEQIELYLAQVQAALHRQVLVEATIVEVELSDRYQSGVDWGKFTLQAGATGINLAQTVLGGFSGPAAGVTGLLFAFDNLQGTPDQDLSLTIRLLKEFGETQVLSSPKIMVLNNQTAILKVVDNEVYFTIQLEEDEATDTTAAKTQITTEVNTVPVGLVMNVTPQIDASDTVTLNVRPTITRIREFVDDPGVALIAASLGVAAANAVNRVPVVQVRETETVLRVASRQTAVLGGLMQDRRTRSADGTPGLSELEEIGGLFEARDRQSVKTELVIFFLRPDSHSKRQRKWRLASLPEFLARQI